MAAKKLTITEFIERAKVIHTNKYNYDKFIYENSKTKGIIICLECGCEFEQEPGVHLKGSGCTKCGLKRSAQKQKKTTEQFINEANIIHNYEYEYIGSYINNYTKILVRHIVCNYKFYVAPGNHLRGHSCGKCFGNAIKTTEDFVEEALQLHNNNYNYDKFIYINSQVRGIILCLKCKIDFEQTPSVHLQGSGCPLCAIDFQRKSIDQFILEANIVHNYEYDYSQFIYTNNRIKSIIIHKNCGNKFYQNSNSHLSGYGCQICNRNGGIKEDICRNIFEELFNNKFITVRPRFLMGSKKLPLELDGFCEELKLAFEHQGVHHYDKKHKFYSDRVIENDQLKVKLCKENNITLIVIPELFTMTKTIKDLIFLIKEQCKEQQFKLPKNFNKIAKSLI